MPAMTVKQTPTRRNQAGQGRGVTTSGKTLSGGAYIERQHDPAEDVTLATTLNAVIDPTTSSSKQVWAAGAQWALTDQGNSLNAFHHDAIDERYEPPTQPLSAREEWIRGAVWALRDQGNPITVYLEAEVADRCPIIGDADSIITSNEGLNVKNTGQDKTLYALCERASASPFSPHHIRPLTAAGKKMSGGADTVALCGAEVAWDVSDITLAEAADELEGQQHEAFRVCMKCVGKARELNAAA